MWCGFVSPRGRVAGPPAPFLALVILLGLLPGAHVSGAEPDTPWAVLPMGVADRPGVVADDDGDPPDSFQVGVVGDWGYKPEERQRLPRLVEAMNGAGLAFSVHDGDIGVPPGSCNRASDLDNRALFDRSRHPLIYTPGDNEWTDCWRYGADPLERLASLRRVFFSDPSSRGGVRMPLIRQSAKYPENVRWSRQGVTFAAIHVVGSNNGLPDRTRPGNRQESVARTAAAIAWLRQTFTVARSADGPAVAVFIHGDPLFDRPHGQRWGYDEFLRALEDETVRFGRPVLLVHGDRHQYILDHPFMTYRQPRRHLANLTRVESFGPRDLAWVRITVNPRRPEVFQIWPERLR